MSVLPIKMMKAASGEFVGGNRVCGHCADPVHGKKHGWGRCPGCGRPVCTRCLVPHMRQVHPNHWRTP